MVKILALFYQPAKNCYYAILTQIFLIAEDCFIGLQSAKKMLQSSAFYQGTAVANSNHAAQKQIETVGNV